jgi:hypothetical protein
VRACDPLAVDSTRAGVGETKSRGHVHASLIAEPARGGKLRWKQSLRRAPLKDDPEAVLAASPLDAGALVGFLHENVLLFVHHDAVHNLSAVLNYLSDAELMLTQCVPLNTQ